jgi:hypothetical protein
VAEAPESSLYDILYGHEYLIVSSITIHEADDFVPCISIDQWELDIHPSVLLCSSP